VIDAAGPWGTGPFTLVRGESSITTRCAIMSSEPFACSWIIESEQRSPQVVLEANRDHWNRERGPRVERAVFRNDLTPAQALDLCLTTDGEVDIVTEVSPADAARVEASDHARLVAYDANRVLVGIINRQPRDVPLDRVEVRRALNLAVDRARVVREGLAGYGTVIPALTPPWCSGFPADAQPYAHDPGQARSLLEEAGWPRGRPLRVAAAEPFAALARLVAGDLRSALGIRVEVIVVPDAAMPAGARALIEKKLTLDWDVLLFPWFDLSSEAPPAAVHREFFGRDGAFRAGPQVEGFDVLFDEMKVQLDGDRLVEVAERIDAYVYDQALALFLCAPQALYAVNDHVEFGPYRTTFEIAEVTVDDGHWSRAGGVGSGGAGERSGAAGERSGAARGTAGRKEVKPGFSGASGNAC
jgi:peptide/nickel transport system substrate-binding protein